MTQLLAIYKKHTSTTKMQKEFNERIEEKGKWSKSSNIRENTFNAKIIKSDE